MAEKKDINVIDSHIHLFDLEQGEYQWLKSDKPPFWPDKHIIEQSFTEDDLLLNEELKLAGFVHIEAGFNNQEPWREIDWLESHCQQPFRSIAGIDLTLNDEQFSTCISQIKTYKSVVGVRDILDDNAFEYLSSKQVKSNLKHLADQQLIFELQMTLTDLVTVDLLLEILKSTANLQIIINHAGFPPKNISTENAQQIQQTQSMKQCILEKQKTAWQQWQMAIKKLGQFKQCAIKCSGFEMINRQYQAPWQNEVINTCLTHFGIQRVMLASNFPLCLFSISYQEYWKNLLDNPLYTQNERDSLCYLNAKRIYQF
ncbi:amidohydrolase family protein [Colwellia sp. 1_MG-2023]|uniref:amidohydrolase family protein n=1 Tax=Colwellia sp. 1_MG-2023 TaxID=3062649 RepID=UPI0026E458DD|nr:amidohydrolase family protein [Colwellia sp. 1_MG-2023]MDO6446281.1 amidohydrolase family protein [Colwellia sp. 1_MG-2023]